MNGENTQPLVSALIARSKARPWTVLSITLALSSLAYLIVEIGGNYWGGTNATCFPILGCNAGFFGFDALEHFLSGILQAALFIWFMKMYPRFNVFNDNFWKNLIILLAIIMLTSVGWELLEFGHDHFISTTPPFNSMWFLYPKSLTQASNSDTMGDFTIELVGALLGAFILKFFHPEVIDGNYQKTA